MEQTFKINAKISKIFHIRGWLLWTVLSGVCLPLLSAIGGLLGDEALSIYKALGIWVFVPEAEALSKLYFNILSLGD
jgi:hypothetical protein